MERSESSGASSALITEGSDVAASTTESTEGVSLGTGSQAGNSEESQDESGSASPGESSSGQADSSSDPSFEILKTCEHGSKVCYPILPSEDQTFGTVKDYGELGLDLWVGAQSGKDGGLGDKNPGVFQRTMFTTYQGPGIGSNQALTVESERLGVDVWIKPDSPSAENFTIVEINGVLAIYYDSTKHVGCIYANGQDPVKAQVELTDFGKFAHLQCSLEGGVLSLRVNGGEPKTEDYSKSVKATSGTLSIGREAELSPVGKMKGRIALLRIWEDLDQMEYALRNEIPYYCKLFKLC